MHGKNVANGVRSRTIETFAANQTRFLCRCLSYEFRSGPDGFSFTFVFYICFLSVLAREEQQKKVLNFDPRMLSIYEKKTSPIRITPHVLIDFVRVYCSFGSITSKTLNQLNSMMNNNNRYASVISKLI